MFYKIYPKSKVDFFRKLNDYEKYLYILWPTMFFLFSGNIKQERFIAALEKTFETFDFLFCRLKTRENNIHAEFSSIDDNYFSVEFEDSPHSLEDAFKNNLFLLPQQVGPGGGPGGPSVSDDLPLLYLKITQLKDGFALCFCFNHFFGDLFTILSILKTLCNYYNDTPIKMEIPKFVNVDSLLGKSDAYFFKNISEFRRFGEQINRTYCADLTNIKFRCDYYGRVSNCRLTFPVDQLNSFKKTAVQYISANDVIAAVLLKIYSSNPLLKANARLSVEIACNMRKHFGLPDTSIGPLFATTTLRDVEAHRSKTAHIADLAVQIREMVAKIDKSTFFEILNWNQNFPENKENPSNYLPSFLVNPFLIMITNWSSFDCTDIHFGKGNNIIAIETLPNLFVTTITFDNRDQQKLVAHLALPESVLDPAKQLGKQSGLFSLIIT